MLEVKLLSIKYIASKWNAGVQKLPQEKPKLLHELLLQTELLFQ